MIPLMVLFTASVAGYYYISVNLNIENDVDVTEDSFAQLTIATPTLNYNAFPTIPGNNAVANTFLISNSSIVYLGVGDQATIQVTIAEAGLNCYITGSNPPASYLSIFQL